MILSLISYLFALPLHQADLLATPNLKLSPTPIRAARLNGLFVFHSGTTVVYDASAPDDRFSAQQVADEAKSDMGLALATSTDQQTGTIVLQRVSGENPTSSINGDQSYRLDVKPSQITIRASTSDGIFYGVQTLKQLMRANRIGGASIPTCQIEDWPVLRYRGWQHDISRGPIPTDEFLRKEIRTLSEFKLNMFTLYTEHVFKLKKHPTIAPNDGITAEEMTALCEYGKRYHVEVVGNFQSFGHFANILKVPGYSQLGENAGVLSPAKEESYKFLSDVYSEIAQAYESPLFVINCDEVSGLGDGPSKELVQKIGVAGVYAQHINRIADLLRTYGKTPMMWGDIALNYPAIVPQLPKDLIVLPWAYDARPSFENQILPFTKYGLRFMVSPGVSCWSQIWPDTQNATTNISNFVRDGARFGAIGVLNTSWDDDGQNLYNDNWYEFAWGAECSWNPVKLEPEASPVSVRIARAKRFDAIFPSVFYGLPDSNLAVAINKLSALRNNPIAGGLNNGALWRDPVAAAASLSNANSLKEFAQTTRDLMATFEEAKAKSELNRDSLEYPIFAIREIQFLADSLSAVYELKANNDSLAKSLEHRVTELKKEFQTLWLQENRNWWLDRNLAKFGAEIGRLRALPNRVVIDSAMPGDGSSPVELHTLSKGAKIYYTLDGTDPSSASTLFSGPFRLTKTATVKAIAIWPNGKTSPIESEEFLLPVLPSKIVTNLSAFGDNATTKAFDGSRESFFWSDGPVSKGDYFELRLDQPKQVSEITVLTGHRSHRQDYLQHGILEISEGVKSFTKVADFVNGIAHVRLSNQMVGTIRLLVTGDQPNWLVIREIELK